MKILSVNAGSSSLKFKMYEMPEEKTLISGYIERIGIGGTFWTIKINGEKIRKERELSNHEEAVQVLVDELFENKVIESLDEIKGIGHRIVHGGSDFTTSTVLSAEDVDKVEALSSLAPLHNPAHVLGIRAFNKIIPGAVAVGVFDTAFHQTMSEEAYLYSVPYEWYTEYGIRKYGFHGTSHKFITETMKEKLGKENVNLIICHIGNGGSLSSIVDGKCADTTMGFTPNAGIMMGARCGDVDYSFIPYLMEKTGMTIKEVDNALNKQSGLLGISGIGSDHRDVEAGMAEGNERAILADKMYVNRVVDYIAKYYMRYTNLDGIVFTAGVGENAPGFRKEVIEGLKAINVKLDEEANETIRFGKEGIISTEDSDVTVYVVPTDEEVMIARDTYNFAK